MLSSRHEMALTPMNSQHLSLSAQANQNPSIEGIDDNQATPVTKELLVINSCCGRENHSFVFQDVATDRFPMLHRLSSHPCTYGQH